MRGPEARACHRKITTVQSSVIARSGSPRGCSQSAFSPPSAHWTRLQSTDIPPGIGVRADCGNLACTADKPQCVAQSSQTVYLLPDWCTDWWDCFEVKFQCVKEGTASDPIVNMFDTGIVTSPFPYRQSHGDYTGSTVRCEYANPLGCDVPAFCSKP